MHWLRHPRPRARSALVAVVALAVSAAACGGASSPTASGPGSAPVLGAAPSDPPAATAGRAESPAPATESPRPPPAAPAVTAPPSASVAPLPPAQPFAMDLYRGGDFVAQYTFEWCVGASIQMTLAMTDTSHDMSRGRQQRLWEMARDASDSPFGGANPVGWVPTLNALGVGPYRLVSEPDLDSALRRAARAIAETGRPVSLVMWRGRHAWVMSGFESLGDPRERANFRVTGVNVLDPLHPHGSSVWGPSPQPDSLLTPEEVGRQFVARTGGRIDLGVPPGYLLILPVLDEV